MKLQLEALCAASQHHEGGRACRSISFAATPAECAAAAIEVVQRGPDPKLSAFVSFEQPEGERPELSAANVAISDDRVLGSPDKFNEFGFSFAAKLGAPTCASRPVEDAGVPNDWEFGQTGKIVAPALRIACGVSAAIQPPGCKTPFSGQTTESTA